MKALLLTDTKRLELVDLPEPELRPDEVLVRVEACGVCGSDVHGYDGSTGRRRPPIVMGHEAAGVIERVGSAVERAKPGRRVTFDSTLYCGACDYCRRGQINLCDHRQVLGVSCEEYRRHGAFAELVAVPERVLYDLPDGLSSEKAALTEAVSVAVHAVRRGAPAPGSTAVVVGSGMIGLLVVQALRVADVGRIVAIDLDDQKLALAAEAGADETINASRQDPAGAVQELTAGRGAESSFEVVGTTPTIAAAVGSVGKGGSVTLVGNLAPRAEFPLQSIVTRELTLHGSCASQGEYPDCLRLMASGQIDVGPLLSAYAPLEEGPAWFERLYAKEPGLMKVVLRP